jgi:sugar lactone lactonase YvrE
MRADNPIRDFEIDPRLMKTIGTDLSRPECILAEPDGSLWAADARGGVVHIQPDGSQQIITHKYADKINPTSDVDRFFVGTLPNGLAFANNGDILISNFGTDCLERMKRTGETEVLFDTIDGKDRQGQFCLSRLQEPYLDHHHHDEEKLAGRAAPDLDDGYIARYDERGIHIVATGLHFTNEVRMDAKEEYLYVVETTGGRILRFRVDEKGDLHDREIYGPTHMGQGAYPDGIAFDSYGNLWGTSVYSDKLWVITPDGEFKVLIDEGDHALVQALDDAFYAKCVTNEILFKTGRGIAPWMASVTFGGPDLKTVYIGSLRATNIPYFTSPVAGLPMVHWKK